MFVPVVVDSGPFNLEGVFAGSGTSRTLVIMLPFIAAGSTKEGPQRLFIELAQQLEQTNIDSLLFDLPPYSGSRYGDKARTSVLNEMERYEVFLDAILQQQAKEYRYTEYVLLSMCSGALPLINWAVKNRLEKVIVLSPHDYSDQLDRMPEEEHKQLFSFKSASLSRPLRLLRIMAAKDTRKDNVDRFWQQHFKNEDEFSVTTHVVPESNYTFYGWNFKKEIINIVSYWIHELQA